MTMIYLERKDPMQNMYRFYSLHISLTLFGEWALIRRWGRIGANGQMMEQWFSCQEEAFAALEKVKTVKEGKGYGAPGLG